MAESPRDAVLGLIINLHNRSVVDPAHMSLERQLFRKSETAAGVPDEEIVDVHADECTQDGFDQDWRKLIQLVQALPG